MEIPKNKIGRFDPRLIDEQLFEKIKFLTPFIFNEEKSSLRERIFCIENKITQIPNCKVCDKTVEFESNNYKNYCSIKCKNNDPESQIKKRQTCLERYGVGNPSQSEEIKQKKINTCLSNYGVKNPRQSEEIRSKASETYFNKTGYYSPSSNPDIKLKKIETSLQNFGVEYPMQNEEIKLKIRETNLERFGGVSPLSSKEVQEKHKQTCLENLGVEFPSQNIEVKKKSAVSLAKTFGERKIENDFSGIVYFIYFEDINLIKIGVTGNLKERIQTLKRVYGNCKILKTIFSENVYSEEKIIHNIFSEFRDCLEYGNGKTEFFSMNILEENYFNEEYSIIKQILKERNE